MASTTTPPVPIRDAVTLILIRDRETEPAVLMGQRGKGAIFMPNKMVFPGGAVDDGDSNVSLARGLSRHCTDKLSRQSARSPETLAATAIRELWEETGAVLCERATWVAPNPDWDAFAATGHQPSAAGLSFVFRAVTPPGRPRRFDARFLLGDAGTLASDPDAIPDATEELSHLRWVPLSDAENLDLAFITRLVLAEVASRLPSLSPPEAVPFVLNDSLKSEVQWL